MHCMIAIMFRTMELTFLQFTSDFRVAFVRHPDVTTLVESVLSAIPLTGEPDRKVTSPSNQEARNTAYPRIGTVVVSLSRLTSVWECQHTEREILL